MHTRALLDCSRRGTHLLFDVGTIRSAFAQDPEYLQDLLETRFDDVHEVIYHLLRLPDAAAGRAFISELPSELRYLMVMIYFEVLASSLDSGLPALH